MLLVGRDGNKENYTISVEIYIQTQEQALSNRLLSSLQDGYQLAWELDSAWQQSIKSGSPIDIDSSLRRLLPFTC